jgi:DNA-directed RNA polymerase subunit D
MEIMIIHRQDDALHFLVEGIDVAFANALRRTMLTRVPAMAIDEVLVLENTSVMYDEILAHRLGLVPLITDLESYNLPQDCDCEGKGCSLCQCTLTLEKESGSEEIPLVKLAPNQRLIIEAYARLGTGIENAKFQPVATVAYKYVPIVEIDRDKCTKCEACVEVCPKKIFVIDKDTLATQNTLDCTMCELCVQECEPEAIAIGSKNDAFLFKVESTGTLPPEAIVEKAADTLKDRIRVSLDFVGKL